jgi:hypothetical protein
MVSSSNYAASDDRMINEWTGEDLEGSGHDLTDTTLASAWSKRKTMKTLVRIAGLQAKIWSQDHENMKQECDPLNHSVKPNP